MRIWGWGRFFVVASIGFGLAGCGPNVLVRDAFSEKMAEPADGTQSGARTRHFVDRRLTTLPRSTKTAAVEETGDDVSRGTGRYLAERRGVESETLADGREAVTLNLVGVPMSHAAKAILGDVLKANYVVDDKVQGTVTIQTTKPVRTDALLDILETSLRANGASLVRAKDVYRIVPATAAERAARPVSVGAARSGAGAQVRIVPLQFVSASEISRILEPVAPAKSVLRSDDARNVIVLNGSPEDLSMMTELIAIFDVDWMKGLSLGLFAVKSSAPEEIAKELETVFGSGKEGPLSGTLKFVPNRRLSAVLVMSSRPQYLDRARDWISKLDRQAERTEEQMFVYKIQNRPADQLAELLAQVLSPGAQRGQQSVIAPRFEPGTTWTQPQAAQSLTTASTAATTTAVAGGGGAVPRRVEIPVLPYADPLTSWSQGPATDSRALRGTRVVADEANNAILVYTNAKEWERIEKILQRLDVVATQVMIEAVIAEVTLNDELKFGLRWSLEKGKSHIKLSDATSGAVSSVFPGFSYFFSAASIDIALNAVAGITDVRVVSAPALMVADNRTAKLQVGDQVPIVTQTAQSVTNPDAPVVNAITLKDTGVILAVTPRVSDGGRVTLEIEQEVSSVSRTTSSGIDSPTIQQRKIKTTVGVSDGQVLALGGLIQQRENVNRAQVPILGSIPLIGNAFRNKDDTIDKTELLIFIRPRVVRDASEARRVTDEFKAQLDLQAPRRPLSEPRLHRDLRRLAE